MADTEWTLEGYWNAVVGRTPADVVDAFDLRRHGDVHAWLDSAERMAAIDASRGAGDDGAKAQAVLDLLQAWSPFRKRALDELVEALETDNDA